MTSVIVPLEILRYWRTHTQPDAIDPDEILLRKEIKHGATWSVPSRFEPEREYGHVQFSDDFAMNNVADGTGRG